MVMASSKATKKFLGTQHLLICNRLITFLKKNGGFSNTNLSSIVTWRQLTLHTSIPYEFLSGNYKSFCQVYGGIFFYNVDRRVHIID
jgi:hypothetical protein